MSAEETISTLLSETLSQTKLLSGISTKLDGVDNRVQMLEKRVDGCLYQMQSLGTAVGAQGQEIKNINGQISSIDSATQRGFNRHSDMIKQLSGKAENSEVYIIQQETIEKTKIKWISIAAKSMALAIALIGALGLGKCISSHINTANGVQTQGKQK